jgi:hypothetical protein
MYAHQTVSRAAVPSTPAAIQVAARIRVVQKVSLLHWHLETMLTDCVSSSVYYFICCFGGHIDRYFVYYSVDNFRTSTNTQCSNNDSQFNKHIVPILDVGFLFH